MTGCQIRLAQRRPNGVWSVGQGQLPLAMAILLTQQPRSRRLAHTLLRLRANDGALSASDDVSINATTSGGVLLLDSRVSAEYRRCRREWHKGCSRPDQQ